MVMYLNSESWPGGAPLLVDLDGTLVATDTLHEQALAALKRNPLSVFLFAWWLRRGKAHLKARLAEYAGLEVEALPFREPVVRLMEMARAEGREVWLVTGANEGVARAVAAQVGPFDGVMASPPEVNLTGRAKAEAVRARMGGRPFIYAGNSHADVPVWEMSAAVVAVNAPQEALARLRAAGKSVQEIRDARLTPGAVLRQMRPHQWLKNLLVFVPALLAHRLREPQTLVTSLAVFAAFSLAASATYICNDLLDLAADRRHPVKRSRPLASGAISIPAAIAASIALALGSAALCLLLKWQAAAILAGYVAASIGYSVHFKRVPALDVVMLAIFYTVRILCAGEATGIIISIWTLAFSMFVFLSLALMKRVVELRGSAERSAVPGRGYVREDLQSVSSQASASAYVAILVVALYINSQQVNELYHRPAMLWAICPLVAVWLNRMLLMASRGVMDADPLVYAVKDKVSWWTGLAVAVVMWLST